MSITISKYNLQIDTDPTDDAIYDAFAYDKKGKKGIKLKNVDKDTFYNIVARVNEDYVFDKWVYSAYPDVEVAGVNGENTNIRVSDHMGNLIKEKDGYTLHITPVGGLDEDNETSEISIIYDEDTDDSDINDYGDDDLLDRTLSNAYETYVEKAGADSSHQTQEEFGDMIKNTKIVSQSDINQIISQTEPNLLANNGIDPNGAGRAKGVTLKLFNKNKTTGKEYKYSVTAKPNMGYNLAEFDIFEDCKLSETAVHDYTPVKAENLSNDETNPITPKDMVYVIHSEAGDGLNVYYDGNGASSGTVAPQLNKTPNTPFNLQTNSFVKNASDGAEFVIRNGSTVVKTINPSGTFDYLGWDEDKTKKTPTYAENQSVTFDAGTYNLFAIWDDLKIPFVEVNDKYYVKVKYDANGGNVINAATKYDEQSHEREFLGWGVYGNSEVKYPVTTKGDITLKGNEYNALDAKFKDVSITIENADDLERTGYTFIGWSENKDALPASIGIIYPNETKKLQKDTTYYAVWQKDGEYFNIAYKKHIDKVSGTKADDTHLYDGAKIGVNNEFSLKYNIKYIIDEPIKEDDFNTNQMLSAEFLGWGLTKNNQVDFLEGQKVTASSLGINYGQTANVYTCFDDVEITLPKVTHTGSKILTGWKDIETSSQYLAGDKILVTKDMTFEPVWEDVTDADPTKYTVIFDGNNPTEGNMPNQEIELNASTPLDKNQYKKSFSVTFDLNDGTGKKQIESVGASFINWTNTEDTAKHYEDEEAVFNLTGGGKSIRLLANWDAEVVPPVVPGIKGWATNKTTDTPDYPAVNGETAPIKVKKDIILYAIYDPDDDNKAKVTVKYFFENEDGSISIRDDLTKVFDEVINKKIDIIPEDFDEYITPPTVTIFVSEDNSKNEVKLIYRKDKLEEKHHYRIIYYLEQDDGSFVKFDEEVGEAKVGTIISSKKEIAGYIKPTNSITVTNKDDENVLECYYRKIKSTNPPEDPSEPTVTPPSDDTPSENVTGHKFTVNYYKVSSTKKNPVLVSFEQGYANVGDVIKADPNRYPGYKLISGESMVISSDDSQNILNAVYMYDGKKGSGSSSGGSDSTSSGNSGSGNGNSYTQTSNVTPSGNNGGSGTGIVTSDGKIATNAKTGDESRLWLYVTGLLLALVAGFVIVRKRTLTTK